MADTSASPDGQSTSPDSAPAATPPTPPKRGPGHRGAEVRDTVAEMAAKAHEISLEAGSKMAAAMKDVINAAAGLTGFVLESARDLVQYMVRRGQMTQEEADKLIRQAEEAQAGRPPRPHTAPSAPAGKAAAPLTEATLSVKAILGEQPPAPKTSADLEAAPKPETPEKKAPAAKQSAHKPVAKEASKPAAKEKEASKAAAKPAPKPTSSPTAKPAAKKSAAKTPPPAAKKATPKKK